MLCVHTKRRVVERYTEVDYMKWENKSPGLATCRSLRIALNKRRREPRCIVSSGLPPPPERPLSPTPITSRMHDFRVCHPGNSVSGEIKTKRPSPGYYEPHNFPKKERCPENMCPTTRAYDDENNNPQRRRIAAAVDKNMPHGAANKKGEYPSSIFTQREGSLQKKMSRGREGTHRTVHGVPPWF